MVDKIAIKLMRRQDEVRMMASGTDSMGLTHKQVEELITETNKYLTAVQEKILELENTCPKFSKYIDMYTSKYSMSAEMPL